MKPIKIIRKNLRLSILAAFSIVLFLSFALIWGALSIALDQYIRSNAVYVLNEARAGNYHIMNPNIDRPPLMIVGSPQNFLRTNLGTFNVDSTYRPISPNDSDLSGHILAIMQQNGLTPGSFYNMRLRNQDSTYFVTSASSSEQDGAYTIFYVDVTDFQRFTSIINALLLYLALFIWFFAIIVTGFLSGSLAKPLRTLQDFAKRIGNGDFTPNPKSFTNSEFEALNESLNHTARQLAKYDNDQKVFFQNASHELRTPLMTINSYAEGIKYGIMEPEKASQTILDASKRLAGMVDDILYISRIDNLTLPPLERTDLRALIQERICLQRPLAEVKNVEIIFNETAELKEPIVINCAVSYMGRAIDNLISNAIRFAESLITIDCKLTNDKVIITVADNGPGFEEEFLPQVFERFFKGKNGLTGIGLSVVRTIAEQHKGTAQAANDENGAVLTIILPHNI
ncbi:MAG: HAMP domain-containing histidine kinase [Defluviitaleaceae bacterium]|nr:HAMP domain-containing histidine kinase [Defluviitaleaceae bacterium]